MHSHVKKRFVFWLFIVIAFALSWPNIRRSYFDFLSSETRWSDLSHVALVIAAFDLDYNRLPNDLDELVARGYMPKTSRLYSCPLLRGALRMRRAYTESDYSFEKRGDEFIVSVRQDRLEESRLGPTAWTTVVYRSGTVAFVPDEMRSRVFARAKEE